MRGLIGVDIGGSGIKAGVVDARRGALIGERVRVLTPQPAVPEAVVAATAEVVAGLPRDGGPVGIGVPGPIVGGVVTAAANIDATWIGVPAAEMFSEAIGRPCVVLNDADAAGIAEMRFGAGRGVTGVVLVLTLGTGIGSALFSDGVLVPNTELGHIEIRGKDAELRASAGARTRRGLSWAKWAPLLDEYLHRVDQLIWPDLVILGGGISRKADRFVPRLTARPPIVPAALRNEAGIVGAGLRARALLDPPRRRAAAGRGPAASAVR
ncbi:polyphosphate--glucose phosphotransferase [Miltoncostaea marina]|uniref:polyphosphate--glucose phosphotransferase n=1 Tax=Miltoncostaea marina TaxID=2843215 RepID=UPI001C3C264A|nr:ROK family protein [Miltoncostaea marina]